MWPASQVQREIVSEATTKTPIARRASFLFILNLRNKSDNKYQRHAKEDTKAQRRANNAIEG